MTTSTKTKTVEERRNFNELNEVFNPLNIKEENGVCTIEDTRYTGRIVRMSVSAWSQGDVDALESILHKYMEHPSMNAWQVVRVYAYSMTDAQREYATRLKNRLQLEQDAIYKNDCGLSHDNSDLFTYVVDSYRLGKCNLYELINDMAMSVGFNPNKITLDSIDFKDAYAVNINGIYVTECMLKSVVKQVMDNFDALQVSILKQLLQTDENSINKIASAMCRDMIASKDVTCLKLVNQVHCM